MPGFLGNFTIGLNFGVNILGSLVGQGGVPFVPPQFPPQVINAPPQVDMTRVITSLSSTVSFHPTLFEDLGLRATAIYNFYTGNEATTFVSDPSASLDDLPRYVSLTWNPASAPRDFSLSRKGLRPFDPRTPTVPAALDTATAANAVANGYISPGVVSALLVPPMAVDRSPRFDEDLFLSSPSSDGCLATLEHVDSESDFLVRSSAPSPARIRVNFIDPSIAGALDENRIMSAGEQTHLATLGALSKIASGLEVVSEFNQDAVSLNPVPQFPAVPETPSIMYIGYVLERHTLGADGSMTPSRSVTIGDPGQSTFIDREVVYGARYSYRIRALLQWTHGPNVGFFGSSSLDRSPVINTAGSNTRLASFYAAEWSDWARVSVVDTLRPEPPDELTVMPLSPRGQIRIVWKMPNDPQRDIASLTLLRSVGIDGRYSAWSPLLIAPPTNGAFIDVAVTPHEESRESYMYAMYSTSFHGERSFLSDRIVARLTERSRYLGEEPLRRAGPAGADPSAHPLGPVQRVPRGLIAVDRAVFYVRGAQSALPLFDRSYAVEVQSLSTGERVAVTLDVDSTDVGLTAGQDRRSA